MKSLNNKRPLNKNKFLVLILTFCIMLIFGSCEKQKEPVIFLTMAHSANVILYNDDNNAIPIGFSSSEEYGPCLAGTYNFEYKFNDSPNILRTGTYTLSTPSIGFKRVYSFQILNMITPGVPNFRFSFIDQEY